MKNSVSFSALLQTLKLKRPIHIASFVITFLFTNIPLDETLKLICYKVFNNNATVTFHGFNRKDFKNLLQLAYIDTYLIFISHIYKQHDGVAMSSPLGLTSVYIFLCHREQIWLQSYPFSFSPTHNNIIDTWVTLSPVIQVQTKFKIDCYI